MTPVRYHEAAEAELLMEIGYLEDRSRGLGRRFHEAVRQTEGLIASFPEAAEEIQPGIRKASLRSFRYPLVYSVESDGLLVLAVAHDSRRPGYWVARATPAGIE
jgi:plasmid stabilization system protein ParE